jgi:hypothetical protein
LLRLFGRNSHPIRHQNRFDARQYRDHQLEYGRIEFGRRGRRSGATGRSGGSGRVIRAAKCSA